MTLAHCIFALVSALLLGGAVAALALRNLIHAALALAVALAGLAAMFLSLHAQFVGFAQVLVYVGAVAILVVFAILLTRGSEAPDQSLFSPGSLAGAGLAAAVFAVLARVILTSQALPRDIPPAPATTVRDIGERLMTTYVLPLEVLGLLLTVALLGAAVLALRDKQPR